MGAISSSVAAAADNDSEYRQPSAGVMLLDVMLPHERFNANAALVRTAFICPGTCQACVDRELVCGNSSCSHFMRPLVETSPDRVSFVCGGSSCNNNNNNNHNQPGPCAQCGALKVVCLVNNNSEDTQQQQQKQQVYDATQLPARVKAVDCGGHLPPPAKHRVVRLAELPSSNLLDTTWQGRHVTFSQLRLTLASSSSSSSSSSPSNYVLCSPKQRLALSSLYDCSWTRRPGDYCPGCVVQWYLGVETRPEDAKIQINLVERFYSGKRDKVDKLEITAPSSPGIYYLNANISLDYHFLNHVNFSNVPENSVAAIQVVCFARWRPETHYLLDSARDKRAIEYIYLRAQHHGQCVTRRPQDCPCRVLANADLQSKVFSFLGPYRD